MSVPQCTSASTTESFPYPPPSLSQTRSSESDHPLGALVSVAQDSQLSCESRLLLVILTLMAWTKGRCWPGIETQAGYLGRSEDSITRYHRELESHGLLIINRSGKHNQYYPTILQGQTPRPKPQQPHRMGAGHGGVSTRMGAGLTPKGTELQNVKNVPATQRPEWLDDYWSHIDQENADNVVKSWPQKEEEEAPRPTSSVEPEMRASSDPDTVGNTDTSEPNRPLYSSVFTHDPACATGAACTPGDPPTPTPDPEKVQYSSANSGDRPRDGHLPRAENISTPKTEKAQYSSAFSQNHGDRGNSQVRAPGDHTEHGAGTRTRKVFDTTLLNEILETTGDYKSRGCWISVLSQVPEEQIRYGMSCLRQVQAEGCTYLERPGAYLLSVLRANNEIRFGSKAGRSGTRVSQGTRTSDRVSSTVDSGHQVPLEPQRRAVFVQTPEPEPPAPTPEELIKGLRFSAQAIGMERTLSLMERTVEGIDVRELWNQVKDFMPDSDPRGIADRFFQVLLTRLKHKASQR